MSRSTTFNFLLVFLCFAFGVNAQFGNFFQGNPFGHNPFGGHQQQQQHQPPGRSQKGWQEMESGESYSRTTCHLWASSVSWGMAKNDGHELTLSPLWGGICLSGFLSMCTNSCRLSLPLSVSNYDASPCQNKGMISNLMAVRTSSALYPTTDRETRAKERLSFVFAGVHVTTSCTLPSPYSS